MSHTKSVVLFLLAMIVYMLVLAFFLFVPPTTNMMRISYYLILTLCLFPLILSCKYFFDHQQTKLRKQVTNRTIALQRALEVAESASQTKSDFLANISHELRTPLNAILGFSGAMRHEAFGPLTNSTYKEYAERIYKSGEHLLSLINNILDLSKIEANRQTVNADWLNIETVLSDAMQIVSGYPEATERKISIIPCKDLPHLLCDEKLLRQVLLNILSNAIKFTKTDGQISIRFKKHDNGDFALTITDNGIGITPEKLKDIRKPFVQIENVMTRTHKGSGLGLTLVDKIMQLHGGQMIIDSAINKGTSVSLLFPTMRVQKPDSLLVI